MNQDQNSPTWAELLENALREPGRVSEAYTSFHNYSMGNQLLAMFQCDARNIPIGPIGTFNHWKETGRFVKKGERAIQLCMPVTCKAKSDDKQGEDAVFTRFIFRRNWFVLAQTDGAEYTPASLPEWSAERALEALEIARVPFELTDGNVQGYARNREVAVSPLAVAPIKTLFHELAHVVLGHTAEAQMNDAADITPRDIRELEAESVAMLLCATLKQPGIEEARGYIQHWYRGATVPEKSAQRIFKAADAILKAGKQNDEEGTTNAV